MKYRSSRKPTVFTATDLTSIAHPETKSTMTMGESRPISGCPFPSNHEYASGGIIVPPRD
jgi:hypothetical protein